MHVRGERFGFGAHRGRCPAPGGIDQGERTAVEIDVPFFDIDSEKVWGATAMVLAEFCAILADL